LALVGALWPAIGSAPALAQTQPEVVIQEFTGSDVPGINLVVWAAVLIGVAPAGPFKPDHYRY
jgi:hypothetical protein